MPSHRFFIPLLGIVFVFILPSLATAEEEGYREMLDLSDEAARAVHDGEFALAAIKFRQAYETYPDPILLKNEMITWFHADDCRSALPPGRAFLKTDDVEPEDEEDVEAVQIECGLRLAEEASENQDFFLATYHLDNLPELERTDEEEARYQAVRQAIPAPEIDASAGAGGAGGANHLGWAQIAGGLTVVGVGLSLHAVALDRQSLLQELSQSEDPADARLLDRHIDQWESYQSTTRWLVPTLYVLGAAAIGSGTYFLIRDSSAGGDTDLATFSPTISGDQVGFSFQQRF